MHSVNTEIQVCGTGRQISTLIFEKFGYLEIVRPVDN